MPQIGRWEAALDCFVVCPAAERPPPNVMLTRNRGRKHGRIIPLGIRFGNKGGGEEVARRDAQRVYRTRRNLCSQEQSARCSSERCRSRLTSCEPIGVASSCRTDRQPRARGQVRISHRPDLAPLLPVRSASGRRGSRGGDGLFCVWREGLCGRARDSSLPAPARLRRKNGCSVRFTPDRDLGPRFKSCRKAGFPCVGCWLISRP